LCFTYKIVCDTHKNHYFMKFSKRTVTLLALGTPGFGLICIALYSSTGKNFSHSAHAFGVFVLSAGAAFLLGALIGFLFGIPKMPEKTTKTGSMYSPNTNLEQISDWLTKILLGAGLTQMDQIIAWVGTLAHKMAKELTMVGDETIFCAALIVFYVVCGFLDGYLITRIVLPRVFARSDAAMEEDFEQDIVD